jgi:transposase-like protein
MARGKKRTRKEHGPQFRAAAVAEALAGNSLDVARSRGVSDRTLRRWIVESKTSPEMAEDVQRKSAAIEADWAEDAKRVARKILGALETLIEQAVAECKGGAIPDKRIYEVAGALKIVGELGITKQVMPAAAPVVQPKVESHGEQSGTDRQGPSAPEAGGGSVVPIRGVRRAAAE